MSPLDRVVESGPLSALDLVASMTPSPSMKFEGHGKQLRTSGWFLGSFFVRSLAALIVLALMMLIAEIWVRCGAATAATAATATATAAAAASSTPAGSGECVFSLVHPLHRDHGSFLETGRALVIRQSTEAF